MFKLFSKTPKVESHIWTYDKGKGRYQKVYGWKNPDPNSPVAAIMIDTEAIPARSDFPAELLLGIELLPRMEERKYNRDDWGVSQHPALPLMLNAEVLIKEHAKERNLYLGSKSGYWRKEVRSMRLPYSESASSSCLMIETLRSLADCKEAGQRGKEIMQYLQDATILSKDPVMREAMLDAVEGTLVNITHEQSTPPTWVQRIDKSGLTDPSNAMGRNS